MTELPRNTFVSFGDIAGNCLKSNKVYNINQIIGT